MTRRRSREFCDRGIVLQEDTNSDNKSLTGYRPPQKRIGCHVDKSRFLVVVAHHTYSAFQNNKSLQNIDLAKYLILSF